jgi:LysM repeat protein
MDRRVAILAFCAALGSGILPAASHAAGGSEQEATKEVVAEQQEAPKGAAAWPNGLRYKVSAGDSLWNLSAKYLGSPWKWVELWERNRFLTNPHFIYPGTEITIFPSPEKDYQMTGAPAPRPVPVATAQNPEPVQEPAPAPAAPAPLPKVVGKQAPAGPPMLDIKPADYVRAGEFVRTLPKAVATIRGAEGSRTEFGEGDKIYLTMKKPLPDGQLLGVYRVRGPVTIPSARPAAGYVKYLVGVIQVTGTEDGSTVGKVRFSSEDLTLADLITDDIPGYAQVRINPGAEGLKAVVIAGRRENREIGPGEFIYIDKGDKAGVEVGNVFRIFNEDSGKMDSVTQEVAPKIEVARAVVVNISQTFATAYVVGGSQSFPPGVSTVRGVQR